MSREGDSREDALDRAFGRQKVLFYTGLHQPSDAKHFERAFISVNRVEKRLAPIGAGSWIMDSASFTEVSTYGRHRRDVRDYARVIEWWALRPNLVAAVAQDYMCEPFIVKKTGLTVQKHQELTVERYLSLLQNVRTLCYIMPVLQGYAPEEYVRHIDMYAETLAHGAYVGVGSVCKRNSDVAAVEAVLVAVKRRRPDLRLHGFGLKTTAFTSRLVRALLYSADSMAWSLAARNQGRNANDWREAAQFTAKIDAMLAS